MPVEFYVVVAIVIAVVIYGGSLLLNPFVKCSVCKGSSRPKGWLFGYAHHDCRKCGGNGRQQRLGHRLFFGRRG